MLNIKNLEAKVDNKHILKGLNILIKPGDMLWTIAYRIYGDPLKYIQIFEENKEQITNPDLIFPGQLFSIPTIK